MLEVIRKLVRARFSSAKEAPIQCMFTLNPQKRKLLLLDLKAILRLPDARLALPNGRAHGPGRDCWSWRKRRGIHVLRRSRSGFDNGRPRTSPNCYRTS